MIVCLTFPLSNTPDHSINQMLTKDIPQRYLSNVGGVPNENDASYNYEIGVLHL